MGRYSDMSPENVVEYVSVEKFAKKLNLEILNDSGKKMKLESFGICRPGLLLAGYLAHFPAERIQLLGNTENIYLEELPPATRLKRLKRLFNQPIPCVIVSGGQTVSDECIELAKKHKVPLFKSDQPATGLINELSSYLWDILAAEIQIHGVLMDVSGVGVLIMGSSGVGKSENALELVKRGHRLVSDDVVVLKKMNDMLVGRSPEIIKHFMEIRGVGIIDIRSLYGASAIMLNDKVELIVELEKWDNDKEYERIGADMQSEVILGVEVPKYVVPVTPGRNISVVIEAAAAAYRLRLLGFNAAREIEKRTTEYFERQADPD